MDELVGGNSLKLFAGKRVLVTGDTGFKGSWLSWWLQMLGAVVTGYALPPEGDDNHFNLLGLPGSITHVDGDIRDYEKFCEICSEVQPQFIFHLAAQALVRHSYENPHYTFYTNVGGSLNVLEAAREIPSLRALIYVTSDKCYKNREWIWGYRENDELGGRDPYSASKAAAELVFESYRQSFFEQRDGFGVASVRAGNVIGGGDWAQDRILPDCIRALKEGRPVVLRNPHATRPWQHVLEPLHGYLLLAAKLYAEPQQYSGSWNFGPRGESVRTVKDLARKVVDCWGSGAVKIEGEHNAPHEASLLQLNCDKAHQLLSWRPCWDFDRTVEETVCWYREIWQGKQACDVTSRQINDYMEARDD